MKVYSGSEIRNVAVVGHNDTGKTSLVTQLLFNAGAIDDRHNLGGGGTAQIQKNIIAERGLAMPREPKVVEA